jgi:hypothetical protein
MVMLTSVGHDRKIKSRKQRADIGKYHFVNRIIQPSNQLSDDASGTLSYNLSNHGKRVTKVINETK